jgi:hypothetical protein
LLRSYSRHSRLSVKLHFEHGPNTDAIRLRNCGTIKQHLPRADQLHDPATRQTQHARHCSVNPLAAQTLWHEHDLSISHALPCFDYDHHHLPSPPEPVGHAAGP